METFEWILLLLVGAVGLTAIARRIHVPYPSLLAHVACAGGGCGLTRSVEARASALSAINELEHGIRISGA